MAPSLPRFLSRPILSSWSVVPQCYLHCISLTTSATTLQPATSPRPLRSVASSNGPSVRFGFCGTFCSRMRLAVCSPTANRPYPSLSWFFAVGSTFRIWLPRAFAWPDTRWMKLLLGSPPAYFACTLYRPMPARSQSPFSSGGMHVCQMTKLSINGVSIIGALECQARSERAA